jgi:glycosyltransferase involved in cell wall biosynthesis
MTKRISVLQISNQLGLGGTDSTLQLLATHLNKHYFEVFAAGIQAGGPREQALRDCGIETLVAHGDFENLARFVRSHDIHVVHLHHCNVPSPILAGRKVALTHQFSTGLFPIAEEVRLSRLLFNSSRTLQKYLSTYQLKRIPENTEVIYNPIDLARITAAQSSLSVDELGHYRKSLGIAPQDFVIGRLGRADIVKWSDFLTEAYRLLVRTNPTIKMLIKTAPRSRIKSLVQEFGKNVVILPESSSLKDLALFFSAIDVYAHASKIGESFGVSIAEAMAFKKPVVVNSTPGADNAQIELVDNAKTGYVVNYPVTFAWALEKLKDDKGLRDQMGEAGYRKVQEKYSAEVVTSQYERILFDMLDLADDPAIQAYANSLVPPISHADIQRSFDDYQRRLNDTYGSISSRERAAYWMRSPTRFAARVRDYFEHRQQVRLPPRVPPA